MANRSLAKRAWYEYLRVVLRMSAFSFFHLRCSGRENAPLAGGALVLSNHQSHLDPVLVGMVFERRLNYLARQTLFDIPLLGWMIESVDSIPIDREGLGLAGLKETLRRVKQEEMVLIFPEGTRTPTGELQTLKPGFAALAKRVKVPLVPVGIDGAFQAWPRSAPYPHTGTVRIHIGTPLLPDEAVGLDDRALVEEVERRIRACHAIARRSRLRALGEETVVDGEPSPRVSLASLAS